MFVLIAFIFLILFRFHSFERQQRMLTEQNNFMIYVQFYFNLYVYSRALIMIYVLGRFALYQNI